MDKKPPYLFSGLLVCFLLIISLAPSVHAQKAIVVKNPDTTYYLHDGMLDSIVVTGSRSPDLIQRADLKSHNIGTVDRLLNLSSLNTSMSGLTKDLQQDLPSMIRMYTPQGIPMLTKYASNNALTSTIPDSSVQMQPGRSGVRYPNPDVPVIIQPDYSQGGHLSLSMLEQTLGLTSRSDRTLTASLNLARAGAPRKLQQYIPEFEAYSTTYAAQGALRTKLPSTMVEIVFFHARSDNEYGGLLGVKQLSESDRGTNVFINAEQSLGRQTLHAGVAWQQGREHRSVVESTSYKTKNEIDAITYTAALSRNNTELRVNYHDLYRFYPWGKADSVHMQRFESVFSHQQKISDRIRFTAGARYDHHDHEPSGSGELLVQVSDHFLFHFNTARLYDAVGSEGLNSLMNSVQIEPHAWTTEFAEVGVRYIRDQSSVNISLMNKTVERGWYGRTATISGWVGRVSANGFLKEARVADFSAYWSLEGVARFLDLHTPDIGDRTMPGPARLEGHARLEISKGHMQYNVQSDLFMGRRMRITEGVSGDLGTQHFVSMSVARTMDFLRIEVTAGNILALTGRNNRILAHLNDYNRKRFVSAPPIIDLDLVISF